MIEEIEAREKAATLVKEMTARHQKESDEFVGAVGYPSCAGCTGNWPCDAAYLLDELKKAQEKLEAVEEWYKRHKESLAGLGCAILDAS